MVGPQDLVRLSVPSEYEVADRDTFDRAHPINCLNQVPGRKTSETMEVLVALIDEQARLVIIMEGTARFQCALTGGAQGDSSRHQDLAQRMVSLDRGKIVTFADRRRHHLTSTGDAPT
jgi:hypothetical protein